MRCNRLLQKVSTKSTNSTITTLLRRCIHSSNFFLQGSGTSQEAGTNHVAIIGAPFSGGQPRDGVQHFPTQFRERGFVDQIRMLHGRKVVDFGDVEIPDYCNKDPKRTNVDQSGAFLLNAKACGAVSKRVASMVESATRRGATCVTLGGDHSIATGSIAGHVRSRPDLCLIWVDAHNDLNCPFTTPSGNIHGMALSFLVKGRGGADDKMTTIPGYEWATPCLDPRRDIVFVGSRDADDKEYEHIAQLGIPMFSMKDIDSHGIAHVMKEAVKTVNPGLDRPMHVSYDVDSLDPVHVPGTGTPVPGGLSLREGVFIGEYLSGLGLLKGVDIVEVNTQLCGTELEKETTIRSSMAVLHACLGWDRPRSTAV